LLQKSKSFTEKIVRDYGKIINEKRLTILIERWGYSQKKELRRNPSFHDRVKNVLEFDFVYFKCYVYFKNVSSLFIHFIQ